MTTSNASLERRVKELEGGIEHLQKIQQEQHEDLNNVLSNRVESQFNLVRYLFKKYQIMKEVVRHLAKKSDVPDSQLQKIWEEAKERVAESTIGNEMLEEYQKEFGETK